MNMRHTIFSSLLTGLIVTAIPLFAQDDAKPLVLGDFQNQGSVTTGYRFTDTHGSNNMYKQLFDLDSGFRLMDFSLFGKAKEGSNDRFADSYSMTMTGLGGDPYTTATLSAHKAGLYDLRVNYRQSRFYWNQNDDVFSNGFTGITSNHDWATVRKMGSVNLLIHASKNLRFSFDYDRNTRDGVNFTTRTLDYYGSSSTWGSFARANPYYLLAPISESSNRITGGIDYTLNSWNFHYKLGYQRFEDAIDGQNLAAGQVSINTNDPTTAIEKLSAASWTDSRKLTTPVSEFSYNGKITNRLEARGGYLYYRYTGPASLDMSANGIARTNSGGTTDAPYSFSLTTRAMNKEPDHVIDQGFTYKVTEWWDVQGDYRYSRMSLDSTGLFRSVTGVNTVVSGSSANQWKIGTSLVDFKMLFTPMTSLLVDVGVRYMKNDVENIQSGVVDPQTTKRIKSVYPTLSASWEPSKKFSIRGDIEETNNGTSYTRITPHTTVGEKIIVRYRPIEKLTIENNTLVRDSKLLISAYKNNVRSNSSNVSWQFNDRVQAFGGFSYDSLYTTDITSFLRGTAPLTDTITDQTVNRVWEGGLEMKPVNRLKINFAGNYVRSTGLGVISGEPPLYGPMKFPYATGSIDYDFKHLGVLALKLQRAYYSEQIITANNFGAKILTVGWTYNF